MSTLKQQIDSDGYAGPVNVFSAAEAADLRARTEAVEAANGQIHYIVKPTILLTAAADIATDPRLLNAVETVLGPDILLWDSAFVIKEPGTESFVSWHQDLTFWGLDKASGALSAWVALSIADETAGCMRFVPGSHLAGQMRHAEAGEDANILSRGQTIETDHPGVPCPLQPGQMSLHHSLCLHASAPNRGTDRRIGLVLNYIRPDVLQTVMDGDTALLVRGEDRYGHFAHEPRATIDFAPDCVAFQARIAEARGVEINKDDAGRLVNAQAAQ